MNQQEQLNKIKEILEEVKKEINTETPVSVSLESRNNGGRVSFALRGRLCFEEASEFGTSLSSAFEEEDYDAVKQEVSSAYRELMRNLLRKVSETVEIGDAEDGDSEA